MRTVELILDEDTERVVRQVWRHLAEAGMPSQENHSHPTNRPHLTLATTDELPASTVAALRAELRTLPCPVVLDGLLRFSGRTHVLAWAVRPDPTLLALHAAVWKVVHGTGDGSTNPLLSPGRWVPHITLGRSRHASWHRPVTELVPASLDEPVQARCVSARSYDSVSRTVVRLYP